MTLGSIVCGGDTEIWHILVVIKLSSMSYDLLFIIRGERVGDREGGRGAEKKRE